jgi:hypothetical protein
MRPHVTLLAIRDAPPTEAEQALVGALVRELHASTACDWLARQKPKIRAHFVRFLEAVAECAAPCAPARLCADVAERFGRDLLRCEFHAALRPVLAGGDGAFADALHLLAMHMRRANVAASVRAPRDRTAQLLRAIAEEDHVGPRPAAPRHELPTLAVAQALARARMPDPPPADRPDAQLQARGHRALRTVRALPLRRAHRERLPRALRGPQRARPRAAVRRLRGVQRPHLPLRKAANHRQCAPARERPGTPGRPAVCADRARRRRRGVDGSGEIAPSRIPAPKHGTTRSCFRRSGLTR